MRGNSFNASDTLSSSLSIRLDSPLKVRGSSAPKEFCVPYDTLPCPPVALYWVLLPFISAHELYRLSMPNKWNFAFDYAYFVTFFAMAALGGTDWPPLD